jgi:hypothetical protein
MGISLAQLLLLPNGMSFVSAILQFFDEYEAQFGHISVAEKGIVRFDVCFPSGLLRASSVSFVPCILV